MPVGGGVATYLDDIISVPVDGAKSAWQWIEDKAFDLTQGGELSPHEQALIKSKTGASVAAAGGGPVQQQQAMDEIQTYFDKLAPKSYQQWIIIAAVVLFVFIVVRALARGRF